MTASSSLIGIMPLRALNKGSIPHDFSTRYWCSVAGVFRRTVFGPIDSAEREGGLDGGVDGGGVATEGLVAEVTEGPKWESVWVAGVDGAGVEKEGLEAGSDSEVEESAVEADVEVRWRRAGEAVP
jgi:hypothetical protein